MNIKKKLSAIGAALAVTATALLVPVTTAPAANAYEAGYSVYVDASSNDGVNMMQSYNNEWVGVAPGHWNMEYGNKFNPQSVNRVLLMPGKCIRVFRLNAAGNGWTYSQSSKLRPGQTPVWIETAPSPSIYSRWFYLGWNRVIVRSYYQNFRGLWINECDGAG